MSFQEKVALLQRELGGEAWKRLFRVSNVRGFLTVLEIWGSIFLALWVVSVWPGFLTFTLAWLVIGSRQLALGLATHEAMHGMLFSSRRVNDFVGKWFCAAPVWLNFDLYRAEHLDHHRHLGTEKDPDIGIREKFPISRKKWILFLLTNAMGLSAWSNLRRRLKMEFGYLTYTVTTNAKPIPLSAYSRRERIELGLRNLFAPTLALTCLTLAMFALGFPQGIALYVLAFFTSLRVFFLNLQVSQHSETPSDAPLVPAVRTIVLNPAANWLLFPLKSNLHVEHHALMTVPYYHLGKLHRELRKHELLSEAQLSSGLVAAMRFYCSK